MKETEVQEAISHEYRTRVKISMIRRAKKQVVDKVVSNYKEEFGYLWSYAKTIKETNKGSTLKMKVHIPLPNAQPIFQRYYICLNALKTGLENGCRHFLRLDGCFLKSLTKGELLVAVGRDGNNQMFPVAWALVEVECTAAWRWFIELLKLDIRHLGNGIGWTIITYQQNGLENATEELLSDAEHIYCARHVYVNWAGRGHMGEELKQWFWRIAKSTTEKRFKDNLKKLVKLKHKAMEDILKVPHQKWCRAFFNTDTRLTWWIITFVKLFNGTLVAARKKPIISLFEDIKRNMMAIIVKKREESKK
ncbi:hypothetical protein REPUB_Repub18cG0034000 [Reevesia pubescens]